MLRDQNRQLLKSIFCNKPKYAWFRDHKKNIKNLFYFKKRFVLISTKLCVLILTTYYQASYMVTEQNKFLSIDLTLGFLIKYNRMFSENSNEPSKLKKSIPFLRLLSWSNWQKCNHWINGDCLEKEFFKLVNRFDAMVLILYPSGNIRKLLVSGCF